MTVKEIMHATTIVEPTTSVLVKINDLDYGIVTERDIAKRCVFRYYQLMQEYSKAEEKKGWR